MPNRHDVCVTFQFAEISQLWLVQLVVIDWWWWCIKVTVNMVSEARVIRRCSIPARRKPPWVRTKVPRHPKWNRTYHRHHQRKKIHPHVAVCAVFTGMLVFTCV